MPRGLPTLIVCILLAAGVAIFAWHVARDNPQPHAATVLTSRPVPEGGWGPIHVMTANVRLDEPKDGTGGGALIIDEEIGMEGADHCSANTGAFQTGGFDQPAGMILGWVLEYRPHAGTWGLGGPPSGRKF